MANENIKNLTKDFVIVWLDSYIENNRANKDTKALIRQLVRGNLLTYDNPDKCIDDITDELTKKRVFLIVSNALGANVVPHIHELPYIQSIYIFCGDQKKAEAWTKPYSKIAGIFTKKHPLLHKISNDIGVYDTDEDLPMSIFHLTEQENSLQQLTKESATFMWYRSILMVLQLMAKYGNSKDEMITECRTIYHNDKIEQKKINDFEQNYCPTKVCWWYTKDSFVYRLLNRALRTQNTEIIFKFRFFINDLYNQIEQLYHQHLKTHSSIIDRRQLTVYRGQHLSMTELDLFKNNINELISMNSFLSATVNQAVAEIFADTNNQLNKSSPKQSVLFTIDIRNMSKETTPFAFIQNYSCCPGEEEVLFSIGAIFKVQSVEQRANMWYVDLQLSKEQNEISQNLSNHMMKQIGSEPDPLLFGWFLFRMNKFDEAERYAKYMLTQLPSNDKAIGNAYNLLGLIYKDTHQLEQSVECYEKALEIYSKLSCHNSPQIIATHCNLGLVHLELGDTRNAEEQQIQAEDKLLNSLQSENTLLIATVESLKAKIQTEYGDNTNALKNLEQALKSKLERLPSGSPSIASTLNAIGIVHEKMNNNVKALEYFQQALEIGNKSLPPDHLDLVDYHINIGCIYDKQKQFKLALKQFELALKIMNDFPREENDRIDKLETYIADTRKKLYQL
ncbi:unnamed protein product [Rotaria sordida]|uniref:NAD(P)(+)--arginine ADP-ribosyltransferase n=1 Tax=Rotaria sordida TaxID=392033 RepID=A0A819FPG4_9BILA|nr:unnamed protein product [Rotaria sordida]CAF3872546.1 unnamed protein product [Rotaria sordida]